MAVSPPVAPPRLYSEVEGALEGAWRILSKSEARQHIALVGLEHAPVLEGAGGIENLICGWGDALSERHRVTVVSIGLGAAIGSRRPYGMPYRRRNEPFWRVAVEHAADLAEILNSLDVDVTSLHNSPVLQRGLAMPTVLTLHNPGVGAWRGPWSGGDEAIWEGIEQVSAVSAVSDSLRESVARLGVRREVFVTPPFAHAAFFAAGGFRRDRAVLFNGRLLKKKGVEDLCEIKRDPAFATVPFTFCDFTQPWLEPEEVRVLRKLIEDTPGTRLVPPSRSREDMAALVGSHAVVAVPSKWDEPFGMVAIEAQAAGTPVVAYARGGLGEAIGPMGHLVEADDVSGFADALVDALLPSSAAKVEAGRQWVADHYSVTRSVGHFEVALQKAVSSADV